MRRHFVILRQAESANPSYISCSLGSRCLPSRLDESWPDEQWKLSDRADTRRLKQLDISFVSQWHRQPTQEEFAAWSKSFIRQEVLYREGLAMGLDKDDTIVKRRMAQKMEFLSEDVAAAHEPTTENSRLVRQEFAEVCAARPRDVPASLFWL